MSGVIVREKTRIAVIAGALANPPTLDAAPAAVGHFAILELDGTGDYHIRHEAAPYDDSPLLRAFEERQVPERDSILRAFFGK